MGNEGFSNTTIYVKKKLKWYEKIWYFIIGKKNKYKYKELMNFVNIGIKEKKNNG